MSILKKIKHILEYLLILILYFFTKTVNYQFLMKIGNVIGFILFNFIRIRRNVTLDNLKEIFPDKPDNILKNIGLKSYQNFVKAGIEYLIFPQITKYNFFRFGWIENFDIIKDELDNNKGLIFLGAHIDNPELTALILKFYNAPVVSLVKKQKNPYGNKFIEKLRTLHGNELIYKGISVRKIFKKLRNGKMLCTIADTSSVDTGKYIDFFGRKVITPVGPAKFAVKLRLKIVPVFSHRTADNSHRIIMQEPIEYSTGVSLEENEIRIMTEYNKRLEKVILDYPEQWFWPHKRWKDAI